MLLANKEAVTTVLDTLNFVAFNPLQNNNPIAVPFQISGSLTLGQRLKTVKPVIKAMRDSGNTWDQIAKHMNKLSIPTARGGKWHGKIVLNAHQRLT